MLILGEQKGGESSLRVHIVSSHLDPLFTQRPIYIPPEEY